MKITDRDGNTADYIIDFVEDYRYGIFKNGKLMTFGPEKLIFDYLDDALEYLNYIKKMVDTGYGV